MANCSTLEQLQYEKHVHRDGDDWGNVVVVLVVESLDKLQHVSDVRLCKTVYRLVYQETELELDTCCDW